MNKYDLQTSARNALKEAIEWHVKEHEVLPTVDDFDDLADSLVPVYTSDLLELLQSNYGTFGHVEPGMDFDSIDEVIIWNVFEYLAEYMNEIFDDVLSEIRAPIELCKTENPRIIFGDKHTQYCPEDRLLDLREEYVSKTGERIDLDEWLQLWESCSLNELENATADQIFGLGQDDNGNWQVL